MSITIEVSILNQKFLLKKGKATTDYVLAVAQYVNDKMADIQSRSKSVATANIAILTAINIADELFKSKADGAEEPQLAQVIAERNAFAVALERVRGEHQASQTTLSKKDDELKLLIDKFLKKDNELKQLTERIRQELTSILTLVDDELCVEPTIGLH